MISLSDFQVGQTVVISDDDWLFSNRREATVAKVGRKYVTLTGFWQRQFYVGYSDDALVEKTEYGAACLLFPTEEAYQMAREKALLERKLQQVFDVLNIRKLSYEQLKRIDAILESQAEED